MSTLNPLSATSGVLAELQQLRQHWVWFLILGIALIVLGAIAISWACIATVTVAAVWVFGFLLMGGGIGEIIQSFSVGRWSGTLLHLLIGLLYAVVGFMMITDPMDSAITLTKVISIFMIVGGIFRIVASLSHRFPGWEWVLLNGGITVLLGLLVYKNWPGSGLWFIGMYLGIDMILNGWAWVALAIGIRRAPLAAT